MTYPLQFSILVSICRILVSLIFLLLNIVFIICSMILVLVFFLMFLLLLISLLSVIPIGVLVLILASPSVVFSSVSEVVLFLGSPRNNLPSPFPLLKPNTGLCSVLLLGLLGWFASWMTFPFLLLCLFLFFLKVRVRSISLKTLFSRAYQAR